MDELEAVASARRGDVRVFNSLVRAHQECAYRVAYRVLGCSDTAAQATEAAFLRAQSRIRSFHGSSFRLWVLSILVAVCSKQCVQRGQGSQVPAFGQLPRRSVNDPDISEQDTLIQAGLATMTMDQRIALVLSDIEGLSYQDIAQVTGATTGTVQTRLSLARAYMRGFLNANRQAYNPSGVLR